MSTKQHYLIVAAFCASSSHILQASHALMLHNAKDKRPFPHKVSTSWDEITMEGVERASKALLDLQEQKPTTEEVTEFFTAVRDSGAYYLTPPQEKQKLRATMWELINRYGKHIVNAKDPYSKIRMLEYVIEYGEEWTAEEFEKLLQVPGIDLEISDSFGLYKPLTLAMGRSGYNDPAPHKLEKLTLLIKYGVDINSDIDDSAGYTPLMHATHRNQPQVVRILLDAGASTGGCNNGESFVDYAKRYPAVLKVYIEYLQQLWEQSVRQKTIDLAQQLVTLQAANSQLAAENSELKQKLADKN